MAYNKENNAPVTAHEIEEFSFSLPTEDEIKQILDVSDEEKADKKDIMKTLRQRECELDEQLLYLRMREGNITNIPVGSVSQEQAEVNGRSVHVANVDYSTKVTELEQCFKECGQIKRITIPADKFSGHPKGFAYVEFADKASVQKAVALTGSQLHGRVITVVPKRSNMPVMSTTRRGAYRHGYAANNRGGFVASRGNSRGGFVASRGNRGRGFVASRGNSGRGFIASRGNSGRGFIASRGNSGRGFIASRGGYAASSRGGYTASSRGPAAMHIPGFKGLVGGKGAKEGFVKNVRYVPY